MLKIWRRLPSIDVRKEVFTATACRGDLLAVGADGGSVGGESGSCITWKVSL